MQGTPEFNPPGDFCECCLTDQPCAKLSQLAFSGVRITLVERFADGQSQNTVTQKFQPLIVSGPDTAMPEGRLQKLWIRKVITDLVL